MITAHKKLIDQDAGEEVESTEYKLIIPKNKNSQKITFPVIKANLSKIDSDEDDEHDSIPIQAINKHRSVLHFIAKSCKFLI